jgi:hypothetical protein
VPVCGECQSPIIQPQHDRFQAQISDIFEYSNHLFKIIKTRFSHLNVTVGIQKYNIGRRVSNFLKLANQEGEIGQMSGFLEVIPV